MGRAGYVVAVPRAMVVEATYAASEWVGDRDRLAHQAFLIGLRYVAPFHVGWAELTVHQHTWDALQREARAWASGTAILGVEVGTVPMTRHTGAILRRVGRGGGCHPRVLWFTIAHAHVARHAGAILAAKARAS
jgi:hypothetical protein